MNIGLKPAWAGRYMRLDPFRLPQAVNYATSDDFGDVSFEIDRRRAAGETLGNLAGVPVAVKDVLCTSDMPTTCSSNMLRNFQPPVDGNEIMQVLGLEPGPAIGRLKEAVREAILEGEIPNEHNAAFQYLMEIKDTVLGPTRPTRQEA